MNNPEGNFRWQTLVAKYQIPDKWRSVWQVINSSVPFILLWTAMVRSLEISYWLTLVLSIPAAGFLIRMFIIFHDCGHGSFFKSSKANEILGSILGLMMFTPFHQWKHDHAIHHATAGDLDRRGVGDVITLTVKEYMALPWHRKVGYRIFRNPLIMFTVGSFLNFILFARFWTPTAGRREKISVVLTDIALAIIIPLLCWIVGWQAFLLVEVPIMFFACSAGVWLFYVQHNFDPSYWERHTGWSFFSAGMAGSSFYKLPKLLQWFTGNIGFHHIHHLSPKIPNYKLEQCHNENPVFQIEPLTFLRSLKSLGYRLWDEERKMLVGFNVLRNYRKPEGSL